MTDALTTTENARLTVCEETIKRGLDTFTDVGNALLEIRDNRLYRSSHDTFERYCKDRWGMSKRHANRSIEAAQVVAEMGPIGPKIDNEAQARELAKVPQEERQTVLEAANEQSGGKITAAAIKAAADDIRRDNTPATAPEPEAPHIQTADEELPACARCGERRVLTGGLLGGLCGDCRDAEANSLGSSSAATTAETGTGSAQSDLTDDSGADPADFDKQIETDIWMRQMAVLNHARKYGKPGMACLLGLLPKAGQLLTNWSTR